MTLPAMPESEPYTMSLPASRVWLVGLVAAREASSAGAMLGCAAAAGDVIGAAGCASVASGALTASALAAAAEAGTGGWEWEESMDRRKVGLVGGDEMKLNEERRGDRTRRHKIQIEGKKKKKSNTSQLLLNDGSVKQRFYVSCHRPATKAIITINNIVTAAFRLRSAGWTNLECQVPWAGRK